MQKLPLKISIGSKYEPAMIIMDQAEANEYFEALVDHNLRCQRREGKSANLQEAIRVERSNLGYFAGYHDAETRERVERLFKCAHPVFGAIAENGQPSEEEEFRKGMEMGQSLRE